MNKKIALTALVAMATLATVVPAEAQRRGGNSASLTLYTGVDYREQSIVITSDTPDMRSINFDEAAGSLIARGNWQVCLDANYSSRCRIYNDSVPNLESFRGRISSVRYMGDNYGQNNGGWHGNNGGFGGGYGGGNNGGWNNNPPRYNGQATTGRSTVFYPGTVSNNNGNRYSVTGDDFCRAQGNRSAVYAGQDRNGNLEDVLCRR